MKLKDFTVARAHLGDRITDDGLVAHQFAEGETRTADPVIVAALVRNGVLIDPDDDAGEVEEMKAEDPAPENKAESAPANKAETVPANKAPDKPKGK
jgi:hypothetical protein